ncbi:MAG: hypothetical protein HN478_22830 [Rhodospirillaceae bacterium]|jgi:tripartite-type tricarboxylate transporter receptor subunit TctC|nr:hypothetical protein [Rhodospirillaceae bacterium]
MLIKSLASLAGAAVVAGTLGLGGQPVKAQTPAEFYDDNVITVLIAFRPGGGFHLYSSVLSQHMRKRIPGKPKILLQFMPGAGGLKAANYFYHVAPKDGSYMSLLSQTASLFQRLNKGHSKVIRYDASKFQYIGRLVSMDAAHMFYKSIKKRDLGALQGTKGTVIACTAGKAAQGYINAKALETASGIKMKILTGYQGSRAQNLAMQRGECNYQPGAWNSWKARRGDWLDQKLIKPMALTALKRHPDLPDTPTIVELAKNDTDRAIMKFIAGYAAVGRAYSMPPGTPKDRVAVLRTAFNGMVKDPAFIADAKKRKMLLGPATGAEVQKVVENIIGTPDDVVLQTRKMLGYK